MRRYAWMLFLIVGTVMSCAPPNPKIAPLPSPSQRIPLKELSISTPGEQGWIVVQRNAQAVQLAKKGKERMKAMLFK